MAAMVYNFIFEVFAVFVVTVGLAHAQGSLVTCDPLAAPANGMSSCAKNGITLYCKATCSAGYRFVTGDTSITKACSDSLGGWQGGKAFPECREELTTRQGPSSPVACSSLKAPVNGLVSCSDNGIIVTCTATCNSGFVFVSGEKSITRTCSGTVGWAGGEMLPMCTKANQCRTPLLASINDSQITGSSVWAGAKSYYFGPERARMDSVVTTAGSIVLAGGWRPATNTLDQYIQVELNNVTRITAIATAGRVVLTGDTANEYVTRYRVLYSIDGSTWEPYSSATVNDQFLDGNIDNVTPNVNTLACPFDAKYIRLNPLTWNEHIALRFEIYGCQPSGSKPVCKSSPVVITTPAAIITTAKPTMAVPPKNFCHAIPPPTNGVVNCEQQGNQEVCVASCAKGYIFETKEVLVKRTCTVDTGAWPSGQTVPACIRNAQLTPSPSSNYTHGCLTTESNCNRIGNGDFQACGGCHYFSTCSEGFLYIRACPERLLFDAVASVCDYHSKTCPSG